MSFSIIQDANSIPLNLKMLPGKGPAVCVGPFNRYNRGHNNVVALVFKEDGIYSHPGIKSSLEDEGYEVDHLPWNEDESFPIKFVSELFE